MLLGGQCGVARIVQASRFQSTCCIAIQTCGRTTNQSINTSAAVLSSVLNYRQLAAVRLLRTTHETHWPEFECQNSLARSRAIYTTQDNYMLTRAPPSLLCTLCTLPRRRWLLRDVVDSFFPAWPAAVKSTQCQLNHENINPNTTSLMCLSTCKCSTGAVGWLQLQFAPHLQLVQLCLQCKCCFVHLRPRLFRMTAKLLQLL